MKRRGSGTKPSRTTERTHVVYSSSHWKRLESLRDRAAKVIAALTTWSQTAVTHGSVARGDVDEKSDVDVLMPLPVNIQLIETALENSGFAIASREIAQATPSHSPKAHIYLDPEQATSVTIPLTPFRSLESEFYAFGGAVTLEQIRTKMRRPGCTKKLLLIEPTVDGHFASPIIGQESEVAKVLGVSVSTVNERERVLTRRDTIGRTGTYLRIEIKEGESFEKVLHEKRYSDPALRRSIRRRNL